MASAASENRSISRWDWTPPSKESRVIGAIIVLFFSKAATSFGKDIANIFFRRSLLISRHWETDLFEALALAFAAHPNVVADPSFHGSKHQVTFSGTTKWAWSRTTTRCELADLLIISFRSSPPSARMCFVQAKREPRPMNNRPVFGANLLQWDLLARRPLIKPHGSFNAPPDLLSSAILPSVGSFLFFFPVAKYLYEGLYCVASDLAPVGQGAQRMGQLKLPSGPFVRRINRSPELIVAPSIACFAAGLFSLLIGTPILANDQYGQEVRTWLKSLLPRPSTAISANLNELLVRFGVSETDRGEKGPSGAKMILLLQAPNLS